MSLPTPTLLNDSATAAAREKPWPNPLYAWYVVIVLMLAYCSSFIDRQILTLLIEPLRRDVGITDVQASLLGGFAFTMFYVVMGLPIARLADQHNRRTIIASGLAVWTVMTAACGMTRSFAGLFVARVGVGVGEAALTPAALSLLADYFPKQRLALALSVYAMGVYLGAGLALVIGGTLIEMVSATPTLSLGPFGTVYSWQLTFVLVAATGVPILVLTRTIREPERRANNAQGAADGNRSSLAALKAFLRKNLRTVTCHVAGFTLLNLALTSYLFWAPTFLIRSYGWTPARTGMLFGIVLLVFGTGGSYAGGWFAAQLAKRGYTDAPIRATAIAALVAVPFAILTPIVPDERFAACGLAITIFLLACHQGLPTTALQLISPSALRAQVAALYFLIGNLIASGFGPTLVALCTDYVFRDPLMLRYSIAIACGLVLPASATLLWLGLKPFRQSAAEGTLHT